MLSSVCVTYYSSVHYLRLKCAISHQDEAIQLFANGRLLYLVNDLPFEDSMPMLI